VHPHTRLSIATQRMGMRDLGWLRRFMALRHGVALDERAYILSTLRTWIQSLMLQHSTCSSWACARVGVLLAGQIDAIRRPDTWWDHTHQAWAVTKALIPKRRHVRVHVHMHTVVSWLQRVRVQHTAHWCWPPYVEVGRGDVLLVPYTVRSYARRRPCKEGRKVFVASFASSPYCALRHPRSGFIDVVPHGGTGEALWSWTDVLRRWRGQRGGGGDGSAECF
jgi:hypothetical protein